MMRILLLILVAGFLIVAYASKPDDKTCIIAAVKAVWGNRTPNVEDKPAMFEQFMNINSKQVIVDDWIFLKRIRYKFPNKVYNIGIGAFKRVCTNESDEEAPPSDIPAMPKVNPKTNP